MARVYLGMSGGVDSSVSAALLKDAGHEVVGVYMKNWTEDLPGMICPWADDLADAKRVAVQLDIPLKVFDFQTEYKHKVVDYMIAEYKAGRTPNPDIMCNQEVKFKLFLEAALEDGAEMISTGHYAATKNGQLLKSKDELKDQTYFLYRVSAEALDKTIFPLGELTKTQVRETAKKKNLSTATKKDSQGICFVGSVGIRDFLSQYVTSNPGEIIDINSKKVLGHHDGAIFYTLGQRSGLGLGGGLPYYVTSKDMQKNEVYVTTNLNDDHLWKTLIQLSDCHWINDEPTQNKTYDVRLRHRAKLVKGKLKKEDNNWQLELEEPERSVAAGQSAVVYDDQVVLGGGIIR